MYNANTNTLILYSTYDSVFTFSLQTTTLALIIVTSALHLFFLTRKEHMDFKHALSQGAGSAVAFCMSISVIWPVGALLSYHMRVSAFFDTFLTVFFPAYQKRKETRRRISVVMHVPILNPLILEFSPSCIPKHLNHFLYLYGDNVLTFIPDLFASNSSCSLI